MKKFYLGLLTLLLCFFISCATAHELAEERVSEYKTLLDGLIADTKDQVLMYLGAPDSVNKLGTQEIWIYHHTLGEEDKSVNTFNRGFFNSVVGQSESFSHEIYDKITLYFNKQGDMTSYDTFVQR